MRRRRRLSTVRRRPRDSLLRLLRIDLLILASLLLVGAGYYLHRHPIRLGVDEPPVRTGLDLSGSSSGDVLLLIPDATPRPAGSLDEVDFTSGWVNALSQEFGVFRTAPLSSFSPTLLDSAALIIVPRSVARRMTAGQVATFEEFTAAGGHLVVEMPTSVWQPLVGVVGDPNQYRPTRRITAFDGAVVRGDLRDDAIEAPLSTEAAPIAMSEVSALDGVSVLMEVDGLPGFLRREFGQGEVFAFYFEAARAVALLQQGSPTADWEIARPAVALAEGYTRTAALVTENRLRHSAVPFADLLERELLKVVTQDRPIPRIWAFPGLHPAALVMTHTATDDCSDGNFMLEWEARTENPSTLFVSANGIEAQPTDRRPRLGLTLVPPSVEAPPIEPIGLFGFHPLVRPLSFEDQIEMLGRHIGEGPPLTRLADGLWDPDYGETFRQLAGLGVALDSSYGAARRATDIEAVDGYSFGTGLPFRPFDRNGLLLPVLEFPVVLHDGAGLDQEWSLRLLDEAGRRYHQLVVADWRCDTMSEHPAAEVVTTWRRLFERARDRDYWITDLYRFARFWEQRSQVRLESQFSPAERRLIFTADVPEPPSGATELPTVAFEARFEQRAVERVTRNGEDVPFVELGRTGDGVFHLYALPAGTSRIEVTYQGPIEIAP